MITTLELSAALSLLAAAALLHGPARRPTPRALELSLHGHSREERA